MCCQSNTNLSPIVSEPSGGRRATVQIRQRHCHRAHYAAAPYPSFRTPRARRFGVSPSPGSDCSESRAPTFLSPASAQEFRLDHGGGRCLDRSHRSLDGLSVTPPDPGDCRSTRRSAPDGQRKIRFGDRSRFLYFCFISFCFASHKKSAAAFVAVQMSGNCTKLLWLSLFGQAQTAVR